MEKRNKNNLEILEKKIYKDDHIIILSKKINNLKWYLTLLAFVIIATYEFFRTSDSKNAINFILNIIIVILLILAGFFIFLFNKTKIKIVKNEKGEILVEKLETFLIKQRLLKPEQAYLYSKKIDSKGYGLMIVYKKKSSELIKFDLIPYYGGCENNRPLYLTREKVIEIGKFLELKTIFKE